MVGKFVSGHSLSKEEQVSTSVSLAYVSIEHEKIEMNPQHLYQKLLVFGIGNVELKTLLNCVHLQHNYLFDQKLLMHVPDRAHLQNGIIKKRPECVIYNLTIVVF